MSLASLITLFTYAALSKWLAFEDLRGQMHNQNFSYGLAETLVWLVPASELIAAGLLLSARTRWYGFALSAFLLLTFTVYIGLVLQGVWERVPCSCGGVIAHLTWEQHLIFNLLFLTLSIIGLCLTPPTADDQMKTSTIHH